MVGFPIVDQINNKRQKLFESADNGSIPAWLGHKAVVIISFPTNVIAFGVGALATTASACIVGSLKIAIYALTFGHTKPTFQTGFIYFGERTLNAGKNILLCVYETFNVAGFAYSRVDLGIQKAIQAEKELSLEFNTPWPLTTIDQYTSEYRLDPTQEERPWKHIAKHYAWSALNIPLNCVMAVGAGVAAIIATGLLVTKVAIYAITNINIPVRVYNAEAIRATLVCIGNVSVDIATDIADIGVIAYKISAALRINTVLAKVRDFVFYVPHAIFS